MAVVITPEKIDTVYHFVQKDSFVILFKLVFRLGYAHYGSEQKFQLLQYDNELSYYQCNWIPIKLRPL